MFLKLIKDFSIKKIVKKSLINYKTTVNQEKIQSIGLLIDESYFTKESELISDIISNGIPQSNIEILLYKDAIKKKEVFETASFSLKDVSVDGKFQKQEVRDFIEKPFDMLISYYDIEKPSLMLLTIQSKAKFKAGFSIIDKRVNAFMVGTVMEKHQEFVSELFKYLKILNKL